MEVDQKYQNENDFHQKEISKLFPKLKTSIQMQQCYLNQHGLTEKAVSSIASHNYEPQFSLIGQAYQMQDLDQANNFVDQTIFRQIQNSSKINAQQLYEEILVKQQGKNKLKKAVIDYFLNNNDQTGIQFIEISYNLKKVNPQQGTLLEMYAEYFLDASPSKVILSDSGRPERITKINEICQFLLLLKGQENIFDLKNQKDFDGISKFGKQFLKENLRRRCDPQIQDNTILSGLSDNLNLKEKNYIQSESLDLLRNYQAGLFWRHINQPEFSASTYSSSQNDPGKLLSISNKSVQAMATIGMNNQQDQHQFFTDYSTSSFWNQKLDQRASLLDYDEEFKDRRLSTLKSFSDNKNLTLNQLEGRSLQKTLTETKNTNQLEKIFQNEVALSNRFNASLLGIMNEESLVKDFSKREAENFNFVDDSSFLPKPYFKNNQFNKTGPEEYALNPFTVDLRLPPLPSTPQAILVDQFNYNKGERLVAKTFFSFGGSKEDDKQKTRKVGHFKQTKDGGFERISDEKQQADTDLSDSKGMRRQVKVATKEKQLEDRQRRNLLLLQLFPYIDEKQLAHNMEIESGILDFWQRKTNDGSHLNLTEVGLITKYKEQSFKQMLTQFQNSIIVARDHETGRVAESVLTPSQIVEKALLLLQGIPSSGVFELDQHTFTFSMNGNKKVYVTEQISEHVLNQSQSLLREGVNKVKLPVNPSLFADMMQAGGYFLHLKEFVECMTSSGKSVGKILQAFSLSVSDFLEDYQRQIIEFPYKVQVMRENNVKDEKQLTEKAMIEKPSLLELMVIMQPLLEKLRLVASICFTKKFIDNIIEAKKQEQKLQQEELAANKELQEMDENFNQVQDEVERRFLKFQAMLYSDKDINGEINKFTAKNLKIEFEENVERIRNQQWLEEFPRGSTLLTYLFKVLVCCESDFQAADLLRSIFSKSIQPLLDMISQFIYTGTFEDPFDEFFVKKINQKQNEETFKISQDPSQIPIFLSYGQALVIYKAGSQLNLLLAHDYQEMSRHTENLWVDFRSYSRDICGLPFKIAQENQDESQLQKEYLNICLKQNQLQLKNNSPIILKFNLSQLQDIEKQIDEIALRQANYLQMIEEAIVQKEKAHIQNLIQIKQKEAEKYLKEKQAKQLEKDFKERQKKEEAMKQVQEELKEFQERREEEKRTIQAEKARIIQEQQELEQIKREIAKELRRQYRAIVEGEMQVLGDTRDWEVIETSLQRDELDEQIRIGEARKQSLQNQLIEEQTETQIDVIMEQTDNEDNKSQLSLDQIELVEETHLEIENFIIKQFIRPLIQNVWQQIDENRRTAHRKRIFNLRNQEKIIEEAIRKKMSLEVQQGFNIGNKLDTLIECFTTDKEKVEMKDSKISNDEVPVSLAIAQCLLLQVKEQFKIVNKCLLHMAFRRLNVLMHFKALRMYFLAGHSDVIETLADQIFLQDLNQTLKDNSLYFINNSLDYALKNSQIQSLYLEQDVQPWTGSKSITYGSSIQLQGTATQLGKNLEFKFIDSKEQILKKAEQVDLNNLDNVQEFNQKLSLKKKAPLMLNINNLSELVVLEYNLKEYPQVELLLTPKIMRQYSLLFFCILKIKRTVQVLNNLWKILSSREVQVQVSNTSNQGQQRMRQMLGARARMWRFVRTLEEHMLIDTIDTAWQWLNKQLKVVQTFDELFNIHSQFLEKHILEKCLISRSDTKISQFVSEMFNVIFNFVTQVRQNGLIIVKDEEVGEWDEINIQIEKFDEKNIFFKKFVEQLANKGFYKDLYSRLENQEQN